MLTFWLPAPVAAWLPLTLAIVLAVGAGVAIYATLARRREEPDARGIATLYGVGLGLVAVSEFMMWLDVARGWSLASVWSIATGWVTFFAIAAAVIVVLSLIVAVTVQTNEEREYRAEHAVIH